MVLSRVMLHFLQYKDVGKHKKKKTLKAVIFQPKIDSVALWSHEKL